MKKIQLKQIVAEFIDSADQSSHQFRRLYNIGIRGMREFNMDIMGAFKTVILDINPNKTAELPCDYITYSKIGVINDKGEVATFKRNDQLSNLNEAMLNMSNRTGDAPEINSIGSFTNPSSYPFLYYNFWSAGTSYNLFGLNSGTAEIGSYKVDEENCIILFGSDLTYSTVVLEYLSDGMDEGCGDYLIDPRASEAFICYIRWKSATDAYKKFSPSAVRELKREYYRERKLAKLRINKILISELNDRKRSLTKLVAKA